MKRIASSWNPDRVAACLMGKGGKTTIAERRMVKMFTEYKGNALAVKTYRGSVAFAADYPAKIVSACYREPELEVELEDGSRYLYRGEGGRFVLTDCDVSASRSSMVGVVNAAIAKPGRAVAPRLPRSARGADPTRGGRGFAIASKIRKVSRDRSNSRRYCRIEV